jgi:hypothetical protein
MKLVFSLVFLYYIKNGFAEIGKIFFMKGLFARAASEIVYHHAAVISIKRVKSFVNKVENQYVCE